jgi:ferredoxin
MAIDIYYFTGTGNTLYLATLFAEKTGGHLIPITKVWKEPRITLNADTLALFYPVYYTDVPAIVKDFAKKLPDLSTTYCIAFGNYGGAATVSRMNLQQYIEEKNGTLSAFYGIHMPQNTFLKAWENNKKIIKKSEKMIDKAVKHLETKKKGKFFSNNFMESVMSPFYKPFISLSIKFHQKITGMPDCFDMSTLIRHADRNFSLQDNCNGCATCEKICPVGNIKMKNKKPEWQHHCENCLACYHYCPQKAIRSTIVRKPYYYKNPYISIKEIMAQSE